MAPNCWSCAVCGNEDSPRVLEVEGHEIVLCRTHAALVTHRKPQTYEQLRDLFRPRCGLTTLADRRSLIPRRDSRSGDRRFFPRPEGRRKGPGRRITDEEL